MTVRDAAMKTAKANYATEETGRTELPSTLLELMAEAMLDPSLRRTLVHQGIVYTSGTLPTGNKIRVAVIKRALEAAETEGWTLTKHA